MDRTIKVGETDPILSRVYFRVLLLDNASPALGEAGMQPQISINGVSGFSGIGISILTSVGFGQYTAQLTGVFAPNDIITCIYTRSGVTGVAQGDTFLVIDSSFTAANPVLAQYATYGTLLSAERFFASRLNVPAWTAANNNDKMTALRMATQAIDRLNFAGEKTNCNQLLQFPRKNVWVEVILSPLDLTDLYEIVSTFDTDIPDEIKKACFLCAYRFLDGWDADTELEVLEASSQKLGPVLTSYDRSRLPIWVQCGIPSGTAWSILLPFLRDSKEILLSRGS